MGLDQQTRVVTVDGQPIVLSHTPSIPPAPYLLQHAEGAGVTRCLARHVWDTDDDSRFD
jgi:hypothetical protein